GRVPDHVPALVSALEGVAKTHPKRDLRLRAAELILAHTGRTVEVAPQTCPRSVVPPEVELESGKVLLTPVAARHPSAELWCSQLMEERRQKWSTVGAKSQGDTCLFAYHFGEFGGKVEAHERTKKRSYVILGGDESMIYPY